MSDLGDRAEELAELGKTVMYLVQEAGETAQLLGLIAVADPVKANARAAISALHDDGIRIVMATGDAPRTADAVAKLLGIDEVHAGVLPEGKKKLIEDLKSRGQRLPWLVTVSTMRLHWLLPMSVLPWARGPMSRWKAPD